MSNTLKSKQTSNPAESAVETPVQSICGHSLAILIEDSVSQRRSLKKVLAEFYDKVLAYGDVDEANEVFDGDNKKIHDWVEDRFHQIGNFETACFYVDLSWATKEQLVESSPQYRKKCDEFLSLLLCPPNELRQLPESALFDGLALIKALSQKVGEFSIVAISTFGLYSLSKLALMLGADEAIQKVPDLGKYYSIGTDENVRNLHARFCDELNAEIGGLLKKLHEEDRVKMVANDTKFPGRRVPQIDFYSGESKDVGVLRHRVIERLERKRPGSTTSLDLDEETLKYEIESLRSGMPHAASQRSRAQIVELEIKAATAGMIGSGQRLKEVRRIIAKVAPKNVTVLIRGETGTGKELVAKAIHDASTRSSKPFNSLNCAALSKETIESQLFGHKKGAFTGADNDHIGYFESVNNGTIFLDEIGEVSPETQVKLLRVLEQGEIQPVGSNTTVRVNVRVIAATNRNLEQAIKERSFREDLYFRLKGIQIDIPPLRESPDDIVELAKVFLKHFKDIHDTRSIDFTPEAIIKMQTYQWPGNIRELRNSIETAVVLSRDEYIGVDDFAFLTAEISQKSGNDLTLPEFRKKTLQEIMELRNEGRSLREIAEKVDMPKSTVESWLKKRQE